MKILNDFLTTKDTKELIGKKFSKEQKRFYKKTLLSETPLRTKNIFKILKKNLCGLCVKNQKK